MIEYSEDCDYKDAADLLEEMKKFQQDQEDAYINIRGPMENRLVLDDPKPLLEGE